MVKTLKEVASTTPQPAWVVGPRAGSNISEDGIPEVADATRLGEVLVDDNAGNTVATRDHRHVADAISPPLWVSAFVTGLCKGNNRASQP